MADLISDGDLSSASLFMQILNGIQQTGQSVLNDLETVRNETLFRFEQDLSALNAKRQRAARVLGPDMACRFVISDALDINQALTSATVRIDSQSATCRERATSSLAQVSGTTFNSATGTVEQFNDMYRVHMLDDTKPTGVFELQLYDSRVVTLLVFDMVSMPSNPDIQVFGSNDGITLIPVSNVSLNGYRVNAWFPTQAMQYIQIRITPTMPDTLGGSTYTFGITSVSASTVDYYLYSELVSKTVTIAPVTAQVRFQADNPDLAYFLQFGDGPVSKVAPGQVVPLPGVVAVSVATYINSQWRLSTGDPAHAVALALPSDVYPSTVSVLDVGPASSVRVAYGLDPAQVGANLASQVIAVHGGSLDLLPIVNSEYSDQSGHTLQVSYVHGPAELTVTLRVQLTTETRSQTPVFNGAWLENVY